MSPGPQTSLPQSREPSVAITGGLSSPVASQGESINQSTNISRNTSMLSMHQPSTPASQLAVPTSERSAGDMTISMDSEAGVSQPAAPPRSGAADSTGYLSVAIPRAAGQHMHDTGRIPMPMFDSFASMTSMEEDPSASAARANGACEADPIAGMGVAAGMHAPAAARQPHSVSAEHLRSSLPDATLYLAPEKKAVDLAPGSERLQASLPLHVKVDLARAQRVRSAACCAVL